MLVFQSGDILVERMLKICAAFQCRVFVLPQDGYAKPHEFAKRLGQLKQNILNVTGLVAESKRHMKDYIKAIQCPIWNKTNVSTISLYRQFIK